MGQLGTPDHRGGGALPRLTRPNQGAIDSVCTVTGVDCENLHFSQGCQIFIGTKY
jgi:hypothetical protein